MKSILKFLMTGIGLALIGLGIGGLVFSEQIFDLLKKGLLSRAEDALGSKVTIASLSYSAQHRGILLENFTVANPTEFKEGDAIRCGKILLQPEWNTLFSKVPVFRKITLENVEIDLRHELGNGTNAGMFIHNIGSYMQSATKMEADTLPREVKVEKIAINSGKLSVKSGVLPIPPIPLDINSFEINSVNEGKPLPVAKLIGVLLRDVLTETITLKGTLTPIADVLKGEVEKL